jgi:putative addiction module component (TIGR02574 family)
MEKSKEILRKAMDLTPSEKAELIDKLMSSLEKPDRDLDELWAKEAENRIDAYEKGELRALSIKEVLEKYR